MTQRPAADDGIIKISPDVWMCAYCQVTLSTHHSTKRHIQLVHMKLQNFACRHCHKRFGTRSSMRRHERKCAQGLYTPTPPAASQLIDTSLASHVRDVLMPLDLKQQDTSSLSVTAQPLTLPLHEVLMSQQLDLKPVVPVTSSLGSSPVTSSLAALPVTSALRVPPVTSSLGAWPVTSALRVSPVSWPAVTQPPKDKAEEQTQPVFPRSGLD